MLKRLTIMFVQAEFFPPTPPFHHSEPPPFLTYGGVPACQVNPGFPATPIHKVSERQNQGVITL